MSRPPFGARVSVTAAAMAMYGIAREVLEPVGEQSSGWTVRAGTGEWRVSRFEVGGHDQPSGEDGGWPGLAVPDPDGKYEGLVYHPGLEPVEVEKRHAGRHRRIRRLPLDGEIYGVVVGHTWRQEGTYYSGGGSYLYGEQEPPGLTKIRQVRVVQVALATQGPARVVDVWHEDLLQDGDAA